MYMYSTSFCDPPIDPKVIEEAERLKMGVVEALAKLTAFANTHQLTIHTDFPTLVSYSGATLPFVYAPMPAEKADEAEWQSSGGDATLGGLWATSTGD